MRGNGRVFRRKGRGGREVAVWWLDYGVDGKRHREPSGTKVKSEALRLLREKMSARESGKLVGRPDRVTFAELRALVERQFVLDGRRSLVRVQDAFTHLDRIIGTETRVPKITVNVLNEYAEQRMGEGASRATVNYELAQVRRAFNLAIENGTLAVMPRVKLPKVHNARTGFFEDPDFAALVVELPPDMADVVRFLRFTGWRRSEVLGLTWDQVDLDGCVVRLAAGDTKGGEGRVFPYTDAPELRQLIEARDRIRDGLFVFHRHGRRIGDGALRGAWQRACHKAGLDGRIVHDLRRSAARDLRRSGVSVGEIMKLCGWRTRSMFDRYNIIDEADLGRAVAKRFQPNGTTTAQQAAVGGDASPLS